LKRNRYLLGGKGREEKRREEKRRGEKEKKIKPNLG